MRLIHSILLIIFSSVLLAGGPVEYACSDGLFVSSGYRVIESGENYKIATQLSPFVVILPNEDWRGYHLYFLIPKTSCQITKGTLDCNAEEPKSVSTTYSSEEGRLKLNELLFDRFQITVSNQGGQFTLHKGGLASIFSSISFAINDCHGTDHPGFGPPNFPKELPF